ncbi:MAG: hypothetical protein E7647_08915 [Ruminococcaceae bacterium]|nr:hypothetical protein [Oscillospiraceae bacterium]
MDNKLPKRKTTRLKKYDYSSTGVYYITICTENRERLLSSIVGTGVPDGPREINVELTAYGKTADRVINQMNAFYNHIDVKSYVIMPDHIHLLLYVKKEQAVSDGPSRTPVPTRQNSELSRFISTFKRFCNKEYGKNIWQARSIDHIIRDREDYDVRMKYIHENPMRWYYRENNTEKTKID